jgi:hypothetical protein
MPLNTKADGESVLDTECVSHFSLQFLSETIYAGANIQRDILEMRTEINADLRVTVSYFHSTLSKSILCREIPVILSSISSCSSSRYLTSGETDVSKLTEAFLQLPVVKTQMIKNVNLYGDGWLDFFRCDYEQLHIYSAAADEARMLFQQMYLLTYLLTELSPS